VAGSKQIVHGNKRAEAFLNGAVAIFEQRGTKSCSVEARLELARCYHRQGLFDIAREIISTAFSELPEDRLELKTFALVIWGVIERDSGRLNESLFKLREAANIEIEGRLVTNRCYLDLATTLKDLALSEHNEEYLQEAKNHFWRALYESEVLGHHRNVGSVENNIGFLLLNLGLYEEAKEHLLRSRRIFDVLLDSVRGAQVHDTLARLYIETKEFGLAEAVIDRAVESLELTDSEAILAEALITKGRVLCAVRRYAESKRCFEAAYKIAQRCGDIQNSARALLGLLEEIKDKIDSSDVRHVAEQMQELVAAMPQCALRVRVEGAIAQFISHNR